MRGQYRLNTGGRSIKSSRGGREDGDQGWGRGGGRDAGGKKSAPAEETFLLQGQVVEGAVVTTSPALLVLLAWQHIGLIHWQQLPGQLAIIFLHRQPALTWKVVPVGVGNEERSHKGAVMGREALRGAECCPVCPPKHCPSILLSLSITH